MRDDHPSELLVVYALGASEAEERTLVEDHLLVCAECREELAALRADMALLAVDNAVEPPEHLRARVMDAAFGATAATSPDGSEADTAAIRPAAGATVAAIPAHRPARRRWASWATPALAAACLALLVTVGVQTTRLADVNNELEKQQQRPTIDPSATTQVMVGDDVASIETNGELSKTVARVSFEKGASNMLVLESMPEPPLGKSWQVWMIDGDGNKVSMNVMEHGAPMAVLKLPQGTKIDAIAITMEKAGGSKQPTTAPLAFGTVSV